jgi:hypothetical protein
MTNIAFPLRVACLTVVFLLTHATLFADAGQRYLIHTRLKMKDGHIENGYYSIATYELLIQRDKTGFFYSSLRNGLKMRLQTVDTIAYGIRPAATDYHFGHELLHQINDTTFLFPNAKIIDTSTFEYPDAWPVVAMLGAPVKIVKRDIEYLSIESIQEIYAPADTKLTLEDGSWINPRAAFREPAGGDYYCSTEALGFQKPGSAAVALLKELQTIGEELTKLRDDDIDGQNKFIRKRSDIIEKLRQEHIIIFSFCAC